MEDNQEVLPSGSAHSRPEELRAPGAQPATAPGRLSDLALIRQRARSLAIEVSLRALERTSRGLLVVVLALDAACAFGSVGAILLAPAWLVPIAVVILGSRQRALGNALHELAHVPGKSNAYLRWVVASLCFDSFDRYRRRHLAHHVNLGSRDLDPDFVALDSNAPPWRIYGELLCRPRAVWENATGGLVSMGAHAALAVACFWTGLLLVVAAVAGVQIALLSALIWVGARATVYHAILCFTELSDHFGLEPGGVISFTRNSPCTAVSWLVHPHNDNFHLTHHLFPRIPTYRLARAHELLIQIPEYAAATHAPGYFFGADSVAHGWRATRQ